RLAAHVRHRRDVDRPDRARPDRLRGEQGVRPRRGPGAGLAPRLHQAEGGPAMKTQTTLSKGEPEGGASDPIMRIRELGHSYGERQVLKGLDFEVGRGEMMCIVGPSGVGKTTLLECLTGLRRPSEGEVLFAGE